MRFYNTLTRRAEEFEPIEPGHARIYTCGPTVYDYAHIGNFRAYVFEDVLRRQLKRCGYKVTQVMNLTDVDDKTIRGAGEKGVSLDDYTSVYKKAFFDDLQALNIEKAEEYPEATRHVPEMIRMIQTLFDKGYAYRSVDGSVYFSISKFRDYGKLAHLDMSGLKSGARVAQDEYDKENAADFALWKAWDEADGEVAWDSPWGKGRPGWHIECSAMSSKYLGESFDIHTGGVDNIFPHHEDEIAQSEAASGKQFVKYWIHCEHLVVEGRKMSKSLGNFYTLRQILDRGHTGREIRYVLLSAQYRQSLNFTFDALKSAAAALARVDECADRLREAGATEEGLTGGDLPDWADESLKAFNEALEDDLNTPEGLAAMFGLINEANRALDSGGGIQAANAAYSVLRDFDRVLGILQSGADNQVDESVLKLVHERDEARKARNWGRADKIRDELAAKGWEVRDTAGGAKVRRLGAS